VLGLAAVVFARTQSEWLRLVAFVIVSAPILVLAVLPLVGRIQVARLGGRMWGSTPLTTALRAAQDDPSRCVDVQTLLQQGADPNELGEELPLVMAIYGARKCGIEPLQWMLDAGADPNQVDEFGTPAWFTATWQTVSPEVLDLVLSRGVDLQAKGRDGRGAVWQAVDTENWAAALRLVEAGAWLGGISPMGLPLSETIAGRIRDRRDVAPAAAEAVLAAVRRRG
jgi:hypothetical protein